MSDLRELQNILHAMAISKGWWTEHCDHVGNIQMNPHELAAKLCLIHSEVSEALECVRRGELETFVSEGKPEGLPTEIADVVIRCLDLAGALGIDLADEIERKRAYNATRLHRHGGKAL